MITLITLYASVMFQTRSSYLVSALDVVYKNFQTSCQT